MVKSLRKLIDFEWHLKAGLSGHRVEGWQRTVEEWLKTEAMSGSAVYDDSHTTVFGILARCKSRSERSKAAMI